MDHCHNISRCGALSVSIAQEITVSHWQLMLSSCCCRALRCVYLPQIACLLLKHAPYFLSELFPTFTSCFHDFLGHCFREHLLALLLQHRWRAVNALKRLDHTILHPELLQEKLIRRRWKRRFLGISLMLFSDFTTELGPLCLCSFSVHRPDFCLHQSSQDKGSGVPMVLLIVTAVCCFLSLSKYKSKPLPNLDFATVGKCASAWVDFASSEEIFCE